MKRFLSLALATLVLSGAVACSDDAAGSDDPTQREIDIYVAAIPAIATYERPDQTGDELGTVVYVAPREGVEIGFEVQVGIVRDLEDWANIRFIDAWEEAITGTDSDQEVRDGGVLVRLGEISDGITSVTLNADRFERADHLISFEVVLHRRSGEWGVLMPMDATSVTLR